MSRTTRRKFLKTSAAVGASLWVSGQTRAEPSKSPNAKVRFACIGVDGRGGADASSAAQDGEIVAICDVDENGLNKAASRYTQAKKFKDYREMYGEIADSFDAIVVATPDHSHTPAAAAGIKLGKHCYCEKPLTKSIYEARMLGDLARKHNVHTQMGNQGTAQNSLRKGAAVIKAGALGTVKEVHVWTNRPVWPQGIDRPAPGNPPASLDWNLFLGPAPERPFAGVYHPFRWRGWWDFGTGALGDMACHTANLPFMALDLRDPVSVEAETSGHNHDSYPNWSVIRFEFPEYKGRAALTMVWYDGGKKPDASLLDGAPMQGSGSLTIGEKGKLYATGDYAGDYKLLGGAQEPSVDFPKSPGHFRELVVAIQGGDTPMSNFPDYAGPLTETILLGNLAVWAADKPNQKAKIEWNAEKLEAQGAPDLEKIIRPQYREGWTI